MYLKNKAFQSERLALLDQYRAIRAQSERLCEPLTIDDYQIQSIPEVSPPKWHLAHVSWFFETFLLKSFRVGYRPFHPRFEYLFNSYYETVGEFHPRPRRGLLSRPTVEEVYRYRSHVDEQLAALIQDSDEDRWHDLVFRVTLGLHHEQQHQELLLMDIKHNFAVHPLRPAYRDPRPQGVTTHAPSLRWIEQPSGFYEVGHGATTFAFDNETPRHRVWLEDHRLASRLVTNGEYLAFIEDAGYGKPQYWLADAWFILRKEGWHAPLYWEKIEGQWWQMTLEGMRPLNEHEPVCHVSFYEADAFARWSGKRLPMEAELEVAVQDKPVGGSFVDSDRLHPRTARGADDGQWYGDLWEWTQTPYGPYPGFRPLAGSLGEYNGKFMCNQMVLRGGCCVTPHSHMRSTYRNFFYPHDRWQFAGIRLAEDV